MIKVPRRRLTLIAALALAVSAALPGSAQAAPRFSFTQYATVSPAEDWSFVAGQFAGDSKTDVVGYHPSNGTLWVGRNTGSAFSFTKYATVSPAEDWQFVAGRFAGDSRSDLAGYHPSNGTVWVGRTRG